MKRNGKKQKRDMASGRQKMFYRVAEVAEHSLSMRKLQERFPDALTIVDATQDKILLITDEDVAAGEPKNPAACAVAQCAMRQGLGGMIGREFAYLIHGIEVTRYHLGRDAKFRTAIYDDRGTMTSGPVVLSAPSRSQRLREMTKRVHAHRTFAKKRQKATTTTGRRNQKEADAIRKTIHSYGFRTWDRA